MERHGIVWLADDRRWRLVGTDARASDGERWDRIVADFARWNQMRAATAKVDGDEIMPEPLFEFEEDE